MPKKIEKAKGLTRLINHVKDGIEHGKTNPLNSPT